MADRQLTVQQLVEMDVIERPMDGNHGEIHPKGGDFVAAGHTILDGYRLEG